MTLRRRIPWKSVAITYLALILNGCGWGLSRDVKVIGKVLLQGAPVAGHGGTLVDFDTMRSAVTRSDGTYELTGVVNGDDPYSVTFTHAGYQPRTITGTITLPSDNSSEITLTLQDVTLTP